MSDRGGETEGQSRVVVPERSADDVLSFSDLKKHGPSGKKSSRGTESETRGRYQKSKPLYVFSRLKVLNLWEIFLEESDVEQICVSLENPECRVEAFRLSDCVWTERFCTALVSALHSKPSYLEQLDLSGNKFLTDSGVNLLSAGLASPNCRVKILRLRDCGLTESSCDSLASALDSNPSYLKELDLSGNSVQDAGVEMLCGGLKTPRCSLQSLRLENLQLTECICSSLASVLESDRCHLHELDLSGNSLQDAGIKWLCDGLKNPSCSLQILRLRDCKLKEHSCSSLASALEGNPSHLEELDLSRNSLLDEGVKLLCDGLNNPCCRLKILRLRGCELTGSCCAYLASTLEFNAFDLKELDLSRNSLRDSGLKLLCEGLRSSYSRLKCLRLEDCELTEQSCACLASTFVMNNFFLKELDLSENSVMDSGVKFLCDQLKTFHCPLQMLRLTACSLSKMSCESIASLLKKTSDIKELDLSHNDLQDEGIQLLSVGLHSPHCKLLTLRLKYCLFSDQGCIALVSALKSRVSPLIELDVFGNEVMFKAMEMLMNLTDHRRGLIVRADHKGHMSTDSFKTANLSKEQPKAPQCFTPELLDQNGEISYRFTSLCPGVFHCELTRLGFTLTRGGELLYTIIQWDESLLDSAGKVPASPLFNIKSLDNTVSELHLPHCELKPDSLSEGPSVVHFSDAGMSIIKALEITDTHVVVNVSDLSAFGLVWDAVTKFLNIQKTISGQVLLFYRPKWTEKRKKLNVFLLPGNVPLHKVKSQQEHADYIEATSSCHLKRGGTYILQCPEAYRVLPVQATFDLNYGPNYHPTFEIRITQSTGEANVTVRDHDKSLVWEYLVELPGMEDAIPTSSSALQPVEPQANDQALPSRPTQEGGPDCRTQELQELQCFQGELALSHVRAEFIRRVTMPNVKVLLDVLLQKRVINDREKEEIKAKNRGDSAEKLIDFVLNKGPRACEILMLEFRKIDPYASDAMLNPGQTSEAAIPGSSKD